MRRIAYSGLVHGLDRLLQQDVLRLQVRVQQLQVGVHVVQGGAELPGDVGDLVQLELAAAVQVVQETEAELGEDDAHVVARELGVGVEVSAILDRRVEVLRIVLLDAVQDADLELRVARVLLHRTHELDRNVRLPLPVPSLDHLRERALTQQVQDLPPVEVRRAVHVLSQHHVVVPLLLALLRRVRLLRLLLLARSGHVDGHLRVGDGTLAAAEAGGLLLHHDAGGGVVAGLDHIGHAGHRGCCGCGWVGGCVCVWGCVGCGGWGGVCIV